jgi:flavin-dependent dehydrogenase
MGDGTFNVGCGVITATGAAEETDLRAMLAEFLAVTPVGRQLAAGERSRERVRGAVLRIGLTGARPYSGRSVLAVGEAIGATYPLTGEGIGKSMETAEIASDLIAEALRLRSAAPLDGYAAELERRLRPKYRAYEVAQRWIAVPWLADIVFRRAERSTRVRRAIEGVLTETVDPARVFSPAGLVRALFA